MSQSLLDLLKSHSPALFDADGNFKFNEFQTTLTQADISFSQETYRLDWRGKSYAKALVNDENRTLLCANHEHNAQNSESQNILIQGDNLAVLKHLREAYRKQIKMIYIDPPYNTGSDGFVYQDDRKYTPEQIAEITGESVEYAEYIHGFINSKASSHSAWLTFMYPRLKLARELLKDDGVIFISIDDNEQAQLKLLCDEIFGEGNFVDTLIVKKSANGMGSKDGFSTNHDFILVYQKNKMAEPFLGIRASEDYIDTFNKQDEFGKYKTDGLFRKKGRGARREDSPNCYYPIYADLQTGKVFLEQNKNNSLKEIFPKLPNGKDGRWVWSKQFAQPIIHRLYSSPKGTIYIKDYWSEDLRQKPRSILEDSSYLTDTATTEIINLFDSKVFATPKPTQLIIDLIDNCCTNNEIILDFFAGSGTLAEAVMRLNAKKPIELQNHFICVQILEDLDKAYENSSSDGKEIIKNAINFLDKYNLTHDLYQITKARIEKAIQKIKDENPEFNGDLGFKEYKVVPVPDNFGRLPETPQEGLAFLENLTLSEQDCQNILTTWCVQDGMPLHLSPQAVDLGGYTAYCYDKVLYLLDQGFNTEHLATILRRLDDTQDAFNIEKIVILELHFTSKAKRELFEAVNQYKPRKGNKLYFIPRNRADKG